MLSWLTVIEKSLKPRQMQNICQEEHKSIAPTNEIWQV